MTNKRQLLYIMSPSYSGSTLLTRLLAAHPDIATVGELKSSEHGNEADYLCSCGALLRECKFWSEVVRQLESQNIAFDIYNWETRITSKNLIANRVLRPLVKGRFLESIRRAAIFCVPPVKQALSTALGKNEAIINVACGLQDGSTFLDESKDPLRALYFYNSDIWDLRVISLIRDGRGIVNSDMKHNAKSCTDATNHWKEKIKEMVRFESYLPAENLLQIRYEDLCNETDLTLQKIEEFAGLPTKLTEARQTGVPIQHILGNEMRLRDMSQIRLDEKWRTELSERDIKAFEKTGGSLNSEIGYRG